MGGVEKRADTSNLTRKDDTALSTTNPNTPAIADKPDTAKQAASIDDFGEKIGGAAKDNYVRAMEKVGDIDIKAVPLSKSFPEPNYTELIAAGANPKLVAMARAVRDSVPDKPRGRYARMSYMRKYVEAVEAAREEAASLIKMSTSKAGFGSSGVTTQAIEDHAALYEAVGHDKSLKEFVLRKHHYSTYKGEEDVTFWSVRPRNKSTAFGNTPRELSHADTKEEAIKGFKAWYDMRSSKPADRKKVKFGLFKMRSTGKFAIGKDVGRHQYFFKEDFDSAKEAREYLNDHYDEIEAHFKAWKEVPAHRRDNNNERTGEDHRKGKDVTPEMFAETFGFRGVEFGNWVSKSGERQEHLNRAYDALADMAAVLNIPTTAISLNGELGLAFGARGKKGAAAHYEGDNVVINLTRKQGAGSLGHEWWLALDNYISRNRKQDDGFMSERPYKLHMDETRPELLAAFKELQKAIDSTGLAERSKQLDTRKVKEYWGTGREMSARSFESYIINKLDDGGYSNDYLANIVSEEGYALEEEYPYIKASEIEPIKEAFDNLFKTIKTKKTDKGTALYSKDQDVVAELTGDEVLSLDDNRAHAARAYYDKYLRGTEVTFTNEKGEPERVKFSGRGWRKLRNEAFHNELKAQLVAAIKPIIEQGKYSGRIELHKPKDNIIAYHYFTGEVKVGDKIVSARIDVEEDVNGNKFYSIEKVKEAALATSLDFNNLKRSIAESDINIKIISINGKSGLTVADAKDYLITQFGNAVKRAIKKGKVVVVRTAKDLPQNVKKSIANFQSRVIAAQEFRDEVISVGRRVTVNHDGSVTLYHRTSQANAKKIQQNGFNRQGFLSLTEGETAAHSNGSVVIPMRVDARDISFSTGTQEIYVENALKLREDGIFSSDDNSITTKYSKDGEIMGAYDPETDTIYVVAENNNEASLSGVFLHEAKHAFDNSKKGKAILETSIRQIKALEKAAQNGTGKLADWMKTAKAAIPSDTPAKDYHEELFAYAVQQYAEGSEQPITIHGIVKRFLDAIRGFVQAHMLKRGMNVKITPATLHALAVQGIGAMDANKSNQAAQHAQPMFSKAKNFFADAIKMIGKGERELFQYTSSTKKGMIDIVNDIAQLGNITIKADPSVQNVDKAWQVTMHSKVDGKDTSKSAEVLQNGKYIWINAASLESGVSRGSLLYHVVATYAHNNGLVFRGDPAGLSPTAHYRRLENMLSSAIRFGTTDHIAPHPKQLKGLDEDGWKLGKLKWVTGDTDANIESMADLSYDYVTKAVPSIKNIRFDFETGEFYALQGHDTSAEGRRTPIDEGRWLRYAASRKARQNGIGSATLKRAVLWNELRGSRHAVMEKLSKLGSSSGLGEAKSILYSKNNPLDLIEANTKESKTAAAKVYEWANKSAGGKVWDGFAKLFYYRPVQLVRDLGTPTSKLIADLAYKEERGDKRVIKDSDFFQRQSAKNGEIMVRVEKLLDQIPGRNRSTRRLNQAYIIAGLNGENVPASLFDITAKFKEVFDDLYDYQTEAGLEVGKLEDYFPRVYDMSKISSGKKKKAFIKSFGVRTCFAVSGAV